MSDRPKTVYRGITIDVVLERTRYPDGREGELEIVRHPGGAAVVAVDDGGRVCLLRQYRHVAGGWIWELPAGRIDPGEAPERTARRELREETGLTGGRWEPLGAVLSSPGVFAETIHLYLARGPIAGEHERHDDEYIEVQWVNLPTALTWADTDAIRDAKTLIGLYRAAARLRGQGPRPAGPEGDG